MADAARTISGVSCQADADVACQSITKLPRIAQADMAQYGTHDPSRLIAITFESERI